MSSNLTLSAKPAPGRICVKVVNGASVEPSLPLQLRALRETGYIVLPRFVAMSDLERLNAVARSALASREEPVEFEADLRYPGAPPSRSAAGGETVRRLLDAYARDPAFAAFATAARIREWMQAYFAESVRLSRVHHNCLMTKHPRFGSLTGWHRDVRYWAFQRDDLVSVWLALGREEAANGGLWFVPGSHALTLEAPQFDEAKFFRAEPEANAALIETAVAPVLEPGDAVFFHAKTLHAAGQNQSAQVKFSLVYTYHGASNAPIAGSRSASRDEIDL